MKMRVRGLTFLGVPFGGGASWGGTAILNGKFLYHIEIFLGPFYVNL